MPDIDPEFQALLWPLTAAELEQLERNIIDEGCRDPLVVWQETGLLLDGHNRLAICTKHDLPFATRELSLPDRAAALDWIDANQYGRRNLTPDQMRVIRGRVYNRQKRQDKGHGDQKSGGQIDTPIPSTAARVAAEFGVSPSTVKRDAQLAAAVDEVQKAQPEVTVPEAIEQAKEQLRPHVANNTGNNEWYTPPEYIAAARQVLGGIDLDPASSAIANQTVGADTFYSREDDGLAREWKGRVWLNPPYSQPDIGKFSEKLVDEYQRGNVAAAIVLVNNATDTAWFAALASLAAAICFPSGRVRFLKPTGERGAPLQGQSVLYFGRCVKTFRSAFAQFGIVCEVLHGD